MIEIQGHADERSSDEYNIRLTRDRAASVVEALVQRGVSRDRMRSGGYGERCPVDPRHNAGGLGAEPPRGVQDHRDARRADGRRGRLPGRTRADPELTRNDG